MTTKKAQKYVVTIRYSNGVRSIAPSVRNAPLTFPTLAAAKEHAAHYTPVYEAKVEKAPAKKPGPKPKSLRDVINKQRQAVEAARRKKITQYKKNILQQLGLVKGSIQIGRAHV